GLGDFVTDGPFPQRMMRVLREMQEEFPCYLVRGNREEYLLENLRHPQNWKAGSSTSGLLDYTFRNLTGQDLEFFEQLPTDGVLIGKMHESGRLIPVFVPQEEIIPDTCRESLFPALRLCHGAPGELRGNFGLHPELLLSHLENLDAAILLGGHSHKQEQREYAGKTYLNPGSLGLALDGVGGHAHFAILTLENSTWQIECFQIPYDLEGYLAEFDRAGLETHGSVLARSLKRTLTCGVNYFYLTVKRVRELADALALTDLDEEVWKKAEQELK
ncbi:MAG: metallophosphoesterase, partial [Fusicatenibacter sp.]|nr:metallophosphoesterase [Fusicatenibacter sp.]